MGSFVVVERHYFRDTCKHRAQNIGQQVAGIFFSPDKPQFWPVKVL